MIYSSLDYILLSKIINEKIIIEKNLENFTNLFLKSLKDKKNIFSFSLESLKEYCNNEDINSMILKYNSNIEREKSKKEILKCKELNIKFLFYEQNRFPNSLKKISIPPIMLYYKGVFPTDISLKNSVSIIGSRNCYKDFGGKLAYKVGKKLSKEKIWNISGLALGIDTFGHLGSLSEGRYTGAFIAQGLGRELYPKENIPLFKKIIDFGGFVATEYPLYANKYYKKFTLRNRLQAGLVENLFVPEFNEKSGTLSTIEYGLKFQKNVYICNPEKTIRSNKNFIEYNKGNALFSFSNEELIKIYPNFDFEVFKKSRIYKIKNNKNYKFEIINKIPDFKSKNIIVQTQLFENNK